MRIGHTIKRPRERVCVARAKEARSGEVGGGILGGCGVDIVGVGEGCALVGPRTVWDGCGQR